MCYSRASHLVLSVVLLVATLGLAACDGSSSSDPSIYGVSGAVSGLASDASVRLELDGKYPITVSSSGSFTFPVAVSTSAAYSVTVAAQPEGQVCTVTHGTGAATTSNVTNVQVACAGQSFTVSGTLTGLASGSHVVLQDNGADTLALTTNGSFSFVKPVAFNATYAVTVATEPAGATCTVQHGSGAGVTANVTSIAVACSRTIFTVSGKLNGLAPGSQVVLENNGADTLALTANGSFSFVKPVAFDATYAVTVATEPAGATCTVQLGTGAGVTANVTSIVVTCSPITFTLSGTLNGLGNGTNVTLNNNAADPLTLSADGKFTFSIPVAESGAYNVTVGTQPAAQTCSVINGQGTQVTANVANITVTCSPITYTIGGSVSGLGASQQVTLADNGGNALTVMADGSFTFTVPVAYGGAYTVTVGTQPTGLVCLVSNGGGSSVSADVTNVGIDCLTNTVSVTTPGTITWMVPNGLTSISIVTTGGGGGGGGLTGPIPVSAGGAGAVVTSTLSVTPGQVLNLVVGGGGGAGGNGVPSGGGYYDGGGGGGGGSSNVSAGGNPQIIAGGGGGGGGAGSNGATGGDAGGQGGAGGNGGAGIFGGGGGGGSGGIGGAAGAGNYGLGPGVSGSNGNGGPGGTGGGNSFSPDYIPGGSFGSGVGAGAGATNQGPFVTGAGGGGYGGGGTGGPDAGGGAGGSMGPAGTTYAAAGNGGGVGTNGGDGSIVITLLP
jgi:hypothetical protein